MKESRGGGVGAPWRDVQETFLMMGDGGAPKSFKECSRAGVMPIRLEQENIRLPQKLLMKVHMDAIN